MNRWLLAMAFFLTGSSCLWAGDAVLEEILAPVAPGVKKWATVCVVEEKDGALSFRWHHAPGDGGERDFWPASVIKLPAVVAAVERVNELGFGLDTAVSFEHEEASGRWVHDTARGLREMTSEVFRRSSNEDFTLLLRVTGLDWVNTRFLVPEKGFPHAALMRGYVAGTRRPWGYVREEGQRITLLEAGGEKMKTVTHKWGGRFYAEERGATVIDAKTGNVSSTGELVECLRRVLFHDRLPAGERYAITSEQAAFLAQGGGGFCGLETRNADSGPTAWTKAAEVVFPKARFYHKCGLISDHAMDLACVDDRAQSGKCFLLMPVVAAGSATKPVDGETLVSEMARKICEAVKEGKL